MTRDALLERVLTDADPGVTPRDARPDADAVRMRERIIREAARPRRRRNVAVGWATGLATAVAAVVVAAAVVLPQTEAVAGAPEPLDFSPAENLAQTIDDAQEALATTSGPAEPLRLVRTASWGFDINGSTGETKVVPQLTTLVWEPDQSGQLTGVLGVAYDPADAEAHLGAEVNSTGEVVFELPIEPGQLGSPVPEGFGASRDEVEEALVAYGMPENPTGAEVVSAITAMLGQWTVTNAQQSQLLAILEGSGDVQALGTTDDRLGRPVAGLRVVSADGRFSDVVLVSLETGRIVGVETTNLTENELVAAGAIMSYMLWDVEESMVR